MKIIIATLLLSYSLLSNAEGIDRKEIKALAKNGHVALTYQVVKKVMFSSVENINGRVCSVYTPSQCKDSYYRNPNELDLGNKKDNRHFKLNIEHTWPQSKGAKELPANSDMHHLFITSKESNSKRANLPFCNAEYDYWQLEGSIHGFDQYAQDCFEPQDLHKGNVARALFYFSVRYDLPINKDEEAVLREWNELDPVDNREIERNKIIQSLQGNSNPFITHPHYSKVIQDF